MHIAILTLNDCFDTGLTTLLDTFTTANSLCPLLENQQKSPYQVSLVGNSTETQTAMGLRVQTQSFKQVSRPDIVIIPALSYRTPDTLIPALSRQDVQNAIAILREWAKQGTTLASACIGTFILAEAGLLNHLKATSTWWLSPLFRARYPDVELDTQRIIVSDHSEHYQVVTAGAGLSHLDLALWFIRQNNPELANLVARYLIVDARPSQSAYIISDHLSHADPLIEQFDRWVRQHITQSFSIDEAASALATTSRTLSRRLHKTVGKSPTTYIQDLRIEQAVHLLKTTGLNVERIAEMVGYANGATLRTLLRQRLNMGVKEIRSKNMTYLS